MKTYKRHSLKEMRGIAIKRGGRCLSSEYVNTRTKLEWQCKNGHIWEAMSHSVLNGNWCLICSGRGKLTVQDLQKIATSRGGRCLSEIYLNSKAPILWECKDGHTWYASASAIRRGSWCFKCGVIIRSEKHRKYTLKDMRRIAEEKGGKCLSTDFRNIDEKVKWQCKNGHVWEAPGSSVLYGKTWCLICAGKEKKTITEMQEIAEKRGGTCLSEKYTNIDTLLRWRCKNGHTWEAVPHNIMAGSWCPICSIGISERICKTIFESVFNKKFPKQRPRWLIGPRGNLMELDGYSKELNLAFEYHGKQHFLTHELFHRDSSLEQRMSDDEIKRELCKENGVILIEVPYNVSHDKIYDFVLNSCEANGVSVPKHKKVDINKLEVFSPTILNELKNIALDHGGECLSTQYINSSTKLKWRCKNGHVWGATPGAIKSGGWCAACSEVKKKTIQDMQKLAARRGGQCLSEIYVSNSTPLLWKCNKNHTWRAPGNGVQQGQWCPKCGIISRSEKQRKYTIKDMQRIAEDRGGKCLSTEYKNIGDKLRWQCKKGHTWEASGTNVMYSNTWCLKCSYPRRK
ncbi:MAG: hypothetical protein UT82_C0021G0009 [Parcubacteria group bacterium GW2011_GWB1_40_14]|nr:MAG: hypothetical protein UT82_C0021G0009 [Parcubacteria group bacterium GW2011_GWB1_40_14]